MLGSITRGSQAQDDNLDHGQMRQATAPPTPQKKGGQKENPLLLPRADSTSHAINESQLSVINSAEGTPRINVIAHKSVSTHDASSSEKASQ